MMDPGFSRRMAAVVNSDAFYRLPRAEQLDFRARVVEYERSSELPADLRAIADACVPEGDAHHV